jgi:hypothetical protein
MRTVKNSVVGRNSMKKYAMGISVSPPSYYNPLYTPTSLQLPRDRKQINVWSFAPGTKIQMADGTEKIIEEVQVGDYVRSANNNIRPITHKYENNVSKDLVKIQTTEGPLNVTWDHLCYVVKPEDIDKFDGTNLASLTKEVSASEIQKNDLVFRAIPQPNGFVSDLINPDLAEMLGAYLAKGSIHNIHEGEKPGKTKFIELKYAKHEKIIVERIKTLSESLGFSVTVNESHTSNIHCVLIESNDYVELCERHCGAVSNEKYLSLDILFADVTCLQRFMNGYFDGDGHQGPYSAIQITTTSDKLAQQLRNIVFPRLGIIDGYTNYKTGEKINDFEFSTSRVPEKYTNESETAICLKDSTTGTLTYSKENFIKHDVIFRQVQDVTIKAMKGVVFDLTVGEDFNIIANGVAVRQCRHF